MANDDQLPSTGELAAKAANNLINKLAKGGWVAYEPTHVKRMAKAQARAMTILAKAETEVTDIQRRAAERWLREEERHQENIEAVVRGALPDLSEKAKPESLNDDWLSGFFDYAKKISDAEMQSLWSKVLAGEVNSPGTFNKRVLQTVSVLEKADAETFTTVSRFMVYIGNPVPLVFDPEDDIYQQVGLTFSRLTHLDTLGLIEFDALSGFARQKVGKQFNIRYGRDILQVTMPGEKGDLPIGKVLFSDVGARLARLSSAEVLPAFPEYCAKCWKEHNIVVAPLM